MAGKKGQKKRVWSDDEKRSICAQARVPGVSVAQVARRYAMNTNLIHKWLRDLSWAGRLSADHPSLRAIAEAQVGDPVRVVNEGGAWMIHDARGRLLGRMARSWSPPEGLGFLRGEVGAVVRWRKTDNKEEFRAHLRREVWEAVCPELVYG